MKHIMVDLETLSTEANAVILSIGAVWFDPHGQQFTLTEGDLLLGPDGEAREGVSWPYDLFPMCFERSIDIQSSIDLGRSVSGSTIKWWCDQTPEARKAAFAGESTLREALNDFADFVKMVAHNWPTGAEDQKADDVCVWGHGPGFDNTILANAFHQLGYQRPWGFRNDRCNRTFLHLAEEQLDQRGNTMPQLVRVGTFHNALDDAITQAMHMQRVNALLREYQAGKWYLPRPIAALDMAGGREAA